MKFQRLGDTDLTVSEIGLGFWTFSTEEWGLIEEDSAIHLVREGIDRGISYFDTADSDGEGYGEELLSKAIADQRHDVIISTKVGYNFYDRLLVQHDDRIPQNFEYAYVRKACEKSLQRLKTDYIDLFQLHHPQIEVFESEQLKETLEDLVKEGKIRYFGVVLGPELGYEAEGRISITEWEVASIQTPFNLIDQYPGKNLFEIDGKTGFVVRSPHASGLLNGTFTKATRLREEDGYEPDLIERLQPRIKRLAELDFLTENMNATIGQLAIKFALSEGKVASVLPNIRTSEQLHEYVKAPETHDLRDHMVERINTVHDEYFHPEQFKEHQ